jgi:NAD(P)-dependent dehydrogenase (short-subunit alcohol dehydrogenase family)
MSRTAVVTGVSSGIGLAIARRLLEDGWQVVGLSRRQPPAGDLPGLAWRAADLADTGTDAVATSVADLGEVHALVHAAGFQESGPLSALDPDAGDRMHAVHVGAAVRLAACLQGRLVDGGRILLIGSRTAEGAWGKSQYAATKAALRALGRSWAMELTDRAITVNVLEPGPTETAMTADPRRAATPPRTPPLGRLVRADEVAAYASFLLEDTGAMVTGQHLVICAGASLAGHRTGSRTSDHTDDDTDHHTQTPEIYPGDAPDTGQ